MRIAMWSGPRNLSTAMMYSFGNRADFAVVDEPFYAAYLKRTGLTHPMRTEVLADQSTDANHVVNQILGPIPGKKPHFYQKHMTQHMIDGVPREWMAQVKNVFLIRHPARVIASFAAKYQGLTLSDIGFVQQTDLYDQACALGDDPIVIDSADIRENPEQMLRALCQALDLNWDPAMLHWPAGGHVSDGVWAAHWYGAVHQSTGFAGPEGDVPELTGELADLVNQAIPHYTRLRDKKLK
ncbi:sulfotransferase-like domain-containing protein [Arenibacterium sp. CAU 1754]